MLFGFIHNNARLSILYINTSRTRHCSKDLHLQSTEDHTFKKYIYLCPVCFFISLLYHFSLSTIQRGTFLFRNRDKNTMQKSVSTFNNQLHINALLDFTPRSCIITLKRLYKFIASIRCFLKHSVIDQPISFLFWITRVF